MLLAQETVFLPQTSYAELTHDPLVASAWPDTKLGRKKGLAATQVFTLSYSRTPWRANQGWWESFEFRLSATQQVE